VATALRAALLTETLEACGHFFEVPYATMHTTGTGHHMMSFQTQRYAADRALEPVLIGCRQTRFPKTPAGTHGAECSIALHKTWRAVPRAASHWLQHVPYLEHGCRVFASRYTGNPC
jgi:hypothetical protein